MYIGVRQSDDNVLRTGMSYTSKHAMPYYHTRCLSAICETDSQARRGETTRHETKQGRGAADGRTVFRVRIIAMLSQNDNAIHHPSSAQRDRCLYTIIPAPRQPRNQGQNQQDTFKLTN